MYLIRVNSTTSLPARWNLCIRQLLFLCITFILTVTLSVNPDYTSETGTIKCTVTSERDEFITDWRTDAGYTADIYGIYLQTKIDLTSRAILTIGGRYAAYRLTDAGRLVVEARNGRPLPLLSGCKQVIFNDVHPFRDDFDIRPPGQQQAIFKLTYLKQL